MSSRFSYILSNPRIRSVHLMLTALLLMHVFHACGPVKKITAPREHVTASGLKYVINVSGNGTPVNSSDLVFIHYEARLADGTVFDSSREREEPMSIRLGSDQLIPGLKEGLLLLSAGDHARLYIPAALAYGKDGYGPVPPDTDLVYQLEILQVIPVQESSVQDQMRRKVPGSDIEYSIIQQGSGPQLRSGMKVSLHYTGLLEDYTVFDSSYERGTPLSVILGQDMLIPGLEQSLLYLKEGDKARIWIPYQMAYGEKGRDPIPARSDLIFDVYVTAAERIDKPVPEAINENNIILTESGLKYVMLKEGQGALPQAGQLLKVHYSGFLSDGSLFDSSVQRGTPLRFVLGAGQLIPGLEEGIALMKTGGRAQLIVPPHLAYGQKGRGPVPPDETLIFDVELIAIEP